MTITESVPSAISDHSAHPGHKLKRTANDGRFFMCDGCMQHGAGTRYRCENEPCNFDLHTCCAVAPDTLTHPMLGDRVFLFLQEPQLLATGTTGGKGSGRSCVACGEDVNGFVYRCFDDDGDIDLHPCCARLLEHAIRDDGRIFALSKEASSRMRETSDDDNRSREVHRPAAARHRRWVGKQVAERYPPSENIQLNNRVFELRREASRPGDMSDDRNRGRKLRATPAARHRWWKP